MVRQELYDIFNLEYLAVQVLSRDLRISFFMTSFNEEVRPFTSLPSEAEFVSLQLFLQIGITKLPQPWSRGSFLWIPPHQ